MTEKIKFSLVLLFILLCIAACGSEEKKTNPNDEQTAANTATVKHPSVCIWDKAIIKEFPAKNGKYVSTMSLGEKINWLGETKVDSSDKNKLYYLVELSDGTTGWASQYVVAPDAQPGITVHEAPIYMRPDLLTLSNKSFDEMELVAISKSQGEWLEVTGNEGKNKGWIKSRLISTRDEDVAVGLLAVKALAIRDSAEQFNRIMEIVNNPSLAGSVFMSDLKEKVSRAQISPEYE